VSAMKIPDRWNRKHGTACRWGGHGPQCQRLKGL